MKGSAKTAVTLFVVVAVGLVAFSAGKPSACEPDGDGGSLSKTGKDEIPAGAARMYEAMAKRWSIDVAFLASIGAQECDHGRCADLKQINSSGCVGWMQLGVGGKCGDYWGRNKCDGNNDGHMDVLDPWDNICAAAKGLRKENMAPRTGGPESGYRAAAGRYYGACVGNGVAYCDQVMARAKHYGFRSGQQTTVLAGVGTASNSASGFQCDAPGADGPSDLDGPGKPFTLTPSANRPGADLTPEITAVVRKIAGRLPRKPVVCTGTNHDRMTSTGNVSDHWAGNAVDICSSANGFPDKGGGYGDTIAAAALMVTGKPKAEAMAMAKRGGAFTITSHGLRFQIIYKSMIGGDHYNHVHVGVAKQTQTRT